MCNILVLKPGQMPLKHELINMVFNNPHGFGLICKKKNALNVIREFSEDTNPDRVWELLEQHKNTERMLHCRWATDGEVDEPNVHPFLVYKSGKREIWFAHNGVISEFKPPVSVAQKAMDILPDASDSRRFAHLFLKDLIERMDGANGKGTLSDPMLSSVIKRFWGNGSGRGILFANDQEPLYLGDWQSQQGADGCIIPTANKTYFNTVSRGPEDVRRKAAEAAKRELERGVSTNTTGGLHCSSATRVGHRTVTQIRSEYFKKLYGMSDSIANLGEDPDAWSDKGLRALCLLTMAELDQWLKSSGDDAVYYLSFVFDELQKAMSERDKLIGKVATNSLLIERFIKTYGNTVVTEFNQERKGLLPIQADKQLVLIPDEEQEVRVG